MEMVGTRIWTRPPSVPRPTVWARYESKKPMPNGRTPKFRIQDYTEEWKDKVLELMTEFFLTDEPLSRSMGVREDPQAVREYQILAMKFLDRKMGLIAVVDNWDELGDKNLPLLAGCNVTAVVTSDEKIEKNPSEKLQTLLEVLEVLEEKKNCFEHYQVSEFLYALGLSVHTAFRGHGLGLEILKARFPLCKAVGIKVTVTVFTAIAAQISAERAGFETLAELYYEEYKDEHGKVIFNIKVPKSMKLMGARVPGNEELGPGAL